MQGTILGTLKYIKPIQAKSCPHAAYLLTGQPNDKQQSSCSELPGGQKVKSDLEEKNKVGKMREPTMMFSIILRAGFP